MKAKGKIYATTLSDSDSSKSDSDENCDEEGNFLSFGKEKKDFKRRDGKDS